jgi:hypothetical protein
MRHFGLCLLSFALVCVLALSAGVGCSGEDTNPASLTSSGGQGNQGNQAGQGGQGAQGGGGQGATGAQGGGPTTVTGNPLLGINTLWANSWYPLVPFANVIYTGRKPSAVNAWDTPVALDVDGNPTADFSILVYEGSAMAGFSGIYPLRFRGQADISGFGHTVSGKSYDAAENITTADVAIDASVNVGIHFTNTRRLPSDATPTGLTELSLMYPGTAYDVDVVTPHFAIATAPFGILRPMQAQNPRNPLVQWSGRTRPRGVGCANDDPGIAFEYLVLLANGLDKDVWINVPYYFDGDALTKLAQLIEFGTDGDLPYTGPFGSAYDAVSNPRPAQHAPSTWTPAVIDWYPPLENGLHAYVELSNELWNFAGAYWGNELQADAVTEYDAGDPYHYGILSGPNPGYLRLGRQGRLHKEMAGRFLEVVGPSGWGDRYRMVLASQIAWYDMMRGPMTYIATVYGGHQESGVDLGPLVTTEDGQPNAFGNPAWPITRYVHYLSGAPYVGGATAAEQAVALEGEVKEWIATLAQYCTLYGVQMIAYEGGAEAAAGYSDPGLQQVIVDELHYWFSQNADAPFVYFGITDNGGYGLSPTIFDLDGSTWPKWAAIYQLAAEL